ncbi:monocarboxylate transporter 12-B isoform X2 [Ixodes scapularis]|uniref:monocarboxylate transporter 12-B isoform X2 n=1 Tax=Ixodes scapularis TaxID=6945 RepID=UPI001A9D781E|nr:monocarboxylate transporter 12-B isoform X2 [Ixodes scapularis]XP_042146695.1 monocarboxylate transporter 12-B isoform X2 [Ixodes scapularis]
MKEFSVSREEAVWTIMLLGGARVLSGLLAGPLGHRFTARPVIIVGSVISALGVMLSFFADSIGTLHAALGAVHGFGSGIVYAMNPIVISEHFVKYKGLAMGINFAGSTLGTFVFPKLLEYLVGVFGFHGALLIFGGLLLNSVAFSLFLRQPVWLKSESTTTLNEVTDETECQGRAEQWTISGSIADRDAIVKDKPESMLMGLSIFKLPMFYVITYSFISFNLSYDCYNSLFIDFAIDKGIPMSSAVTMMSLSSVPDLVGRLVLPAVTDRGLIKRRTLMMALLALVGVLYIVLPYQQGYDIIFVLTSAVALLLGCGVVLFPVLLVEYVGIDRMAMATGMLTALSATFSFGKPSIIGFFSRHPGILPLPVRGLRLCRHLSVVGLGGCSSSQPQHRQDKVDSSTRLYGKRHFPGKVFLPSLPNYARRRPLRGLQARGAAQRVVHILLKVKTLFHCKLFTSPIA